MEESMRIAIRAYVQENYPERNVEKLVEVACGDLEKHSIYSLGHFLPLVALTWRYLPKIGNSRGLLRYLVNYQLDATKDHHDEDRGDALTQHLMNYQLDATKDYHDEDRADALTHHLVNCQLQPRAFSATGGHPYEGTTSPMPDGCSHEDDWISGKRWIPVHDLFYSQSSVSHFFRDGRCIFETVCELLKATCVDEHGVYVTLFGVQAYRMKGRYYSCDNRRLKSLKTYEDILSSFLTEKRVFVEALFVASPPDWKHTTDSSGEIVRIRSHAEEVSTNLQISACGSQAFPLPLHAMPEFSELLLGLWRDDRGNDVNVWLEDNTLIAKVGQMIFILKAEKGTCRCGKAFLAKEESSAERLVWHGETTTYHWQKLESELENGYR